MLVKKNGKEYEFGKTTFEEQPEEGGDIEILPKKISKVIISEDGYYYETLEYIGENTVSVKEIHTSGNEIITPIDTYISTYTNSSNKITIGEHESPLSYSANVTLE